MQETEHVHRTAAGGVNEANKMGPVPTREVKNFEVMEKNGQHILYFNVPLHGHVNPTLDVVAELVKRGYTVTYFASEKFRSKLEGIGANLIIYDDLVKFNLTRTEKNIFNTALEMLTACESIMDSLMEQISQMKFNLIMYDVSAVWGKFFAAKFNVPSVCCFPGLTPQWRAYMSSAILISRGLMDAVDGSGKCYDTHELKKKIIAKHGLPKHPTSQLFSGSLKSFASIPKPQLLSVNCLNHLGNEMGLNIVCTSPYFQPGSEYLDTNHFVFVGPVLGARKEDLDCIPWDEIENNNNPLIYISMGTLYYQDPAFFTLCIKTFRDKDYTVIMSIGNNKVEDIGEIPKNFIVRNYVPQLAVLKKTSVYISHGGMGGISESIFFSVPMLLLPKTIEQQINANRMSELGASINLKDESVSGETLLKYVKILLGPAREDAGGVGPAVDALEKVIKEEHNEVVMKKKENVLKFSGLTSFSFSGEEKKKEQSEEKQENQNENETEIKDQNSHPSPHNSHPSPHHSSPHFPHILNNHHDHHRSSEEKERTKKEKRNSSILNFSTITSSFAFGDDKKKEHEEKKDININDINETEAVQLNMISTTV